MCFRRQNVGVDDELKKAGDANVYRRWCEHPLRPRARAALTRRSSSSPLTPARASRNGPANSSSDVARALLLTARSSSIKCRRYALGVIPSSCARRRTAETFRIGSFPVCKLVVVAMFSRAHHIHVAGGMRCERGSAESMAETCGRGRTRRHQASSFLARPLPHTPTRSSFSFSSPADREAGTMEAGFACR